MKIKLAYRSAAESFFYGNMVTKKYVDELTYELIGCAIEVHKTVGPGLTESVYEKCYSQELSLRKIEFTAQQQVPLTYKGLDLDAYLRFDILARDLVIVELKAIEFILPVHEAILMSYMKMLEKPKGIIINFNCLNIFSKGQKTFVNEYYERLPNF